MYDVIVVGAGPGGYHAAIRAAQEGLKTALVEKGPLGGVCLQEGCIPTKSLIHSAEVLQAVKEARKSGIKVDGYSVDWAAVQKRKDSVVKQLTGGLEQLMDANGVEVIRGTARFAGPKRVLVKLNCGGELSIEGGSVIIATGSVPSVPPIPGIELPGVVGSREALEPEAVPERLLVVGGGVIGTEFASLYNSFGSEVTIIEFLPRIMATVDGEISRRMEAELKRRGIKILTSTKIKAIQKSDEGLKATVEHRGSHRDLAADTILLATGRKPYTEGLGLESLGIEFSEGGGIKVNSRMETSVPGIYAVGDVTGGFMLAHVASAEGLVAVDNILGRPREMDYRAVPNVIFTFPEVASAGVTEEEATGRGIKYKTSKFMFAANSRAAVTGTSRGMVKLITTEEDEKIIGAHVFGPSAGELIHEMVLAIGTGASAEDVARTVHAHPTFSEAVMEAAHGISGKFIHMKKFQDSAPDN